MIFCVCSITWCYIWADVSIKAGQQSPLRLTAVCLACKQPSYLGFALWPSSMHGSLVTPSAYAYGKVIENPAADMAAILFSLMRQHLHLHTCWCGCNKVFPPVCCSSQRSSPSFPALCMDVSKTNLAHVKWEMQSSC